MEISNNPINLFDNLILEVSTTDKLLFKGNTITHSGTFPKLFPQNPAIKIKHSKNIHFDNNSYSGNVKVILEVDGSQEKLKFK